MREIKITDIEKANASKLSFDETVEATYKLLKGRKSKKEIEFLLRDILKQIQVKQ